MNGSKLILSNELKYTIFVLLALLASQMMVHKSYAADAPAYEITQSQISEGSRAIDLIQEYLDSKGWTEGKNEKNGKRFFVSVGVGAINARRDTPNYITSRSIAYQKAFLLAQQDMVQYLESEITVSLEDYYSEPSEVREKARIEELTREGMALQAAKAQVAAMNTDIEENAEYESQHTAATQAQRLLQIEIDGRLREAGFDPKQPVEAQQLKKILSTAEFKKSTNVVANSRVAGMQVFKSFEVLPEGNQGEIGVVTISSDRLHNLANAIFSGKETLVPKGAPRKPLKEQIPTNSTALLSTFGITAKVDENGQLGLVSYGQAGARSNSTRALQAADRKAKINAMEQIRLFAGAIVKTMEATENSESMTQLEDEVVVVTDDSYEESRKVAADALKISGIQTIHRWDSVHPLTGHYLAGQVVFWTPSSSSLAKKMKRQVNSAPAKNQGVQNKPGDASYDKTTGKAGSYIDEGVEGSEDF